MTGATADPMVSAAECSLLNPYPPSPRGLAMSDLHNLVVQKFQEAFGEPHRIAGDERQWSLRALAYISAVNVLVNGTPERPMVWVFDPHDPGNGIFNVAITTEAQIDQTIQMINTRVKQRGQQPTKSA